MPCTGAVAEACWYRVEGLAHSFHPLSDAQRLQYATAVIISARTRSRGPSLSQHTSLLLAAAIEYNHACHSIINRSLHRNLML